MLNPLDGRRGGFGKAGGVAGPRPGGPHRPAAALVATVVAAVVVTACDARNRSGITIRPAGNDLLS